MRALLVSLLLAGLALSGLDRYLADRSSRNLREDSRQTVTRPTTAPVYHVNDGGSGIPPCCH